MVDSVEIGPLAVVKKLFGTVKRTSPGDPILHDGYISSLFGPRDPIQLPNGHITQGFHYGLDIAAPEGTAIYAPADGRLAVVDAIDDSGGKYVYLACGKAYGYEKDSDVGMLFLHLSLAPGKAGDTIKRGQVIGLVGETGWATGPHLHLEVRVLGTGIDPLSVLVAHVAPKPVATRSPVLGPLSLAERIKAGADRTSIVPLMKNDDGRLVYNVIVP